MSKIQTYNSMTVEVIAKTDAPPAALTATAVSITMHSDPEADIFPVSESFCSKLIRAEHMSLFEHAHITFLIQGVSRAFLAQITRQRTANPTSGSQHYQDYSDYPMVLNKKHSGSPYARVALNTCVDAYKDQLNAGVPPQEARMVLPNAATTNYLWTIDARNLVYFLRQRLCNRNVDEMRIFALRVLSLAREWFPELFNNVHAPCLMDAYGCNQVHIGMQCDDKVYTSLD
jgi:thymidylate synthase (FAD)